MTTPPVFLCDLARLGADRLTLDGPEGRHATVVRRLGPGERVDLTDGAGLLVRCVVVTARPGELDLEVIERDATASPDCRVVVVQAILKGDRGELAVELMTEVGVDEIVPWAAERCVARWRADRADKSLSRWRSAAREAAKQSRRAWFPLVSDQVSAAGALERVSGASLALLLDPAAARQLADVARPGTGGPGAGEAGAGEAGREIVLIVGPEGGVSEAETAAFTQAGAVPVRLGPSVLRGSTAGAVAGALVLSKCGRWNRAPL